MKSKLKFVGFVLSILMLVSCATIVNGSRQLVHFDSVPNGVSVSIDGKEYGRTPVSVSLKRSGHLKGEDTKKKSYSVKLELDGFKTHEFQITRKVDGIIVGNIIFGALIGLIVDASTGAMYRLTPNQIVRRMGESTASNYSKNSDIYFAVTMEVNPEWKKVGQLERV